MTHTAIIHHRESSLPLPWLNIGLCVVALVALVVYVIQANSMAAQAWRTSDAQDRLTALQEVRNTLVSQQSSLADRSQLTALAAQAGMVPAGAVVYLVQDRPVAAR